MAYRPRHQKRLLRNNIDERTQFIRYDVVDVNVVNDKFAIDVYHVEQTQNERRLATARAAANGNLFASLD